MIPLLQSISVRRLIQARRSRVFAAFSRAEALAQWFTPGPEISVEVLAFRFVPEGGFRLRYTMPGGVRKVVGGSYHVIAPPERLAFSWIWEAPDPHAGIPTRVVVAFLEKGEATEVVLTHERLPSDEAGSRHAAGWEATLDRLDGLLAAEDSPGPAASEGARHA